MAGPHLEDLESYLECFRPEVGVGRASKHIIRC